MSISNGFEKWLLKLKFLTFAKLHILSSNSFIIISINVLKIPTLAGRKRLNTGRVCQNWICNWCSMFVFSSFDILQRFPQNIFITFLFWTENGSKLKSDQNKMFQYLLFSWNANPYPIEVNNDVLIANWSFANIRTAAFPEKSKRKAPFISYPKKKKTNKNEKNMLFSFKSLIQTFYHIQTFLALAT